MTEINYDGFTPVIACRGADSLPLDALEEFQGNLKSRSKKEIEKIMRSIYEYGFSFPFFVWVDRGVNRILDGHGRVLALNEMRKRGAVLPCFPVSYIESVDEAEAKQKLLRLNSAYGSITQEGFIEFTSDIEVDKSAISIPGISLKDTAPEPAAEESEDDSVMSGIQVIVAVNSLAEAHRLLAELLSDGHIAKIKDPKA